MKSIKQLRYLYALPLLLGVIAFISSALGSRTLYMWLAIVLLAGTVATLQFFSMRIKRAVRASSERATEGATLAGALFSTLWTTFAAALLITIRRH
jgi:hypothetical protein